MRILKYRGQNLTCWCFHLWLLWTAFTFYCLLCWLPVWLQSGGSMFHPLSHIYAKTPFCYVETVANCVFDWLSTNAAPTLNTAFLLTNIHTKWWICCFLKSSTPLLSHTTSIYDQPKWVCEVFGVFQDNCRIWATWAFSIICVCMTTFKVSIVPLNHCFRCRVQITLIKSLLCLNSIFSHQKAML